MIGFKTIESYAFDDCVMYLDSHKSDAEDYYEILNMYRTLFNQLQKEDDDVFNKCRSVQDYEHYLSRFSAQGHMLYQPKHKKEAIERINNLKITQEKERKNNKEIIIIFLVLGLIVGLLSQRFLPYIVASLIKQNSSDCGILGLPISYGVLFLFFVYLRIYKKNKLYNRFIALFGGIIIACVPMFFYLEHNEVSYGSFPNYGILYGGDNDRVGIADSFGNPLIAREYDCFYETGNEIIGITDNHGSLTIDRYTKGDFKPIKSQSYWIVEDNIPSKSLREVIASGNAVIINQWRFNTIDGVTSSGKELLCPANPSHNHWGDPEIMDLRVMKK